MLAACGDNLTALGAAAPFAAQREACAFTAGAMPAETLGGLGPLPIRHLIVLTEENRSFDHYLGHHPMVALGKMDGIPGDYTNPDEMGGAHAPTRATSTCIKPDLPHDWTSVHAEWNAGLNDGFYSAGERESHG